MDEQKNLDILLTLEGKTSTINELIDLGFSDKTIIQTDSRSDNPFLGKITYHTVTYYKGLTLKILSNELVQVVSNPYNQSEAMTLNKIRDKRLELEGLKNRISTYRFEFKDNEVANELEKQINPLENEIISLELQLKLDKLS